MIVLSSNGSSLTSPSPAVEQCPSGLLQQSGKVMMMTYLKCRSGEKPLLAVEYIPRYVEQLCRSMNKITTEIYQYTITPIDVQSGDVLGMFEPDKSKLELYYTDKYGPVNYYTSTGKDVIVPPDDNFDINAGGMTVKTQCDLPLLTVTIGKLLSFFNTTLIFTF